ncbi:MAG: ATP-binding protein [Sphaerochaeta sp.]
MTSEEFLIGYEKAVMELRLPFSPDDFLGWSLTSDVTPTELDILDRLLGAMVAKKNASSISTLKKLSRIPQKNPLLFGNFNMDLLNEKAKRQVLSLKSLSFISSKRNVIMIGPTGTGKTHLAMAIGNECCSNKMKAYFIKMDELKDKFHDAIVGEKTGKLLNGLSKYSCLIVDEVGYCKLNRQETLLFFQLVDRIGLKETGSIVLTSNKDLSQWPEVFDEDDALECAIDRLWDKAICMTFSGQSHRGSDREQIELNFLKFR